MQNLKRTFVMLGAVGLLSVPAYVAAQDPQPPATPSPSSPATRPEPAPAAPMPSDAPSAKSQTAKGELVSVDDVAKSITIKDDKGTEQKFTYDDKTDVTGGREGIAGLATKAGSKVTVKYTDGAAGKLATKIEVAKAPGGSQQ